ncbi:hypothetical protein Tco_0839969 [Tanacetum coccineum]|uniref:Uncharacterized protein n=1 Tax=Tanacetum coccineum TaxID=301880 RepID=A0ABQ5AUP3_9ASTR
MFLDFNLDGAFITLARFIASAFHASATRSLCLSASTVIFLTDAIAGVTFIQQLIFFSSGPSVVPLVATLTYTKKRSLPGSSTLGSASKREKNAESSGSGAPVAGESATRDDNTIVLVSFEAPSPAAISKAEEFVPALLLFGMGESAAGSSQEAADDAGSQQLVSRGGSKAPASQSSTSTQSEPLVSSRLGPRSKPMAQHIPTIVFYLVQDSDDTPREDHFYASMSVDPSMAKDIYRPNWELTNDFTMEKGPLCRSFIGHLATPWQFA